MDAVNFFDLKDDGYEDHRGWVVNPLPEYLIGEEGFGHLHITSVKAGSVRGNHYHAHANEVIFVFGGGYRFYYVTDGETSCRDVDESELLGISIAAGIAHALKNTGDDTIYVMSYYDREYDLDNPDTVRKIVTE
ncbi:MAG: hypothetical protein GF315_11535 [candidate division Zixibacteria bacterium]|nr:hypothetical protein [candidate division Zixibacteria bacterium]